MRERALRSTERRDLRDQAGEQLGVHIAAGQDRDRDFSLYIDLSGQQCRERHRSARLDHKLEFVEGDRAWV